LAEDGKIPVRYPLTETPHRRYRERTEWNVRDSGATLIFATGKLTGGTRLTEFFARQLGKPCFRVDFADPPDGLWLKEELISSQVQVLNIAGPRESTEPGIYQKTVDYLNALLDVVSEEKEPRTK
jgi:hypothetical protein